MRSKGPARRKPKVGFYEQSQIALARRLIGVDEVGRGCLAGPVFAACASLDYEALRKLKPKVRRLIRDSKTLTSKQRQEILPTIRDLCIEAYTAMADVSEIESLNIQGATFLAMHRCLSLCELQYDLLLIDGNRPLPRYTGPQETMIKGDSSCYAIAAASIIAKEARDDFMRAQANVFPQYGFESHVGYGTELHLERLQTHGICHLHRRNFAPIAALSGSRGTPPSPSI